MTENIDQQFTNDMAQLKALMQVIDEITQNKVPLIARLTENLSEDTAQLKSLMTIVNKIDDNKVPKYEMYEMTSKSTLQALQYLIDDCNALDDGETIDTLNQTRIEIKYLCSIINDLRERIKENETEIRRLESAAHRG